MRALVETCGSPVDVQQDFFRDPSHLRCCRAHGSSFCLGFLAMVLREDAMRTTSSVQCFVDDIQLVGFGFFAPSSVGDLNQM